MADQIKLRRDTASTWATTNPTLAAGEPGFETDTGKLKIGTGSASWTALPYVGATTAYTDEQARDAVGAALVAGTGMTITVDDPGDHITLASTGGGGGGSGTLPTIVGTSSMVNSATATCSLTVPAGVAAGDLLVVFGGGNAGWVGISGGGNATGHANMAVNNANFHNVGVALAVAGSTSPSSTLTATFLGGTVMAHLICVRGWKKILGAAAIATSTSATTSGVPLIAAGDPAVLCLGFGSWRTLGTISGNLPTTEASGNNGANVASKSFSGPGVASGRYAFLATTTAGGEQGSCGLVIGG